MCKTGWKQSVCCNSVRVFSSPFINLVQANSLFYFIIVFLHGRKLELIFFFFRCFYWGCFRSVRHTRIHQRCAPHKQCKIIYTSYNYYFVSFPTEIHRTGTIHFTTRVHNNDSNNDILRPNGVCGPICFFFFLRVQRVMFDNNFFFMCIYYFTMCFMCAVVVVSTTTIDLQLCIFLLRVRSRRCHFSRRAHWGRVCVCALWGRWTPHPARRGAYYIYRIHSERPPVSPSVEPEINGERGTSSLEGKAEDGKGIL